MAASPIPIVCGVDFSPNADRAMRCAAGLSKRLRRPLHLVAAIDPLLAEAARVKGRSAEFAEQIRRDVVEQAATLSVRFDGIEVETDEPARVLHAAAEKLQSDLVVVGTRGLGQAARLFLGSTTMRLLRSTDRAVLAVPGHHAKSESPAPAWPETRRVICGVDFSDGSKAAVTRAAALAAALGAKLTLAHAVAPIAAPIVWRDLVTQIETEHVDQGVAELEQLASTVGGDPDIVARLGTPVDVLTALAGDDESAILVVGLHGASHHRPGSTALRLLSTSNVPVLAVPE